MKDKRRFDANIPYKRVAGEIIGGSLSPSQRYERALATTLTDQLENLTRREEVMAEYAPEAGEDTILTLLNDNQLAHVSRRKVERDLQGVVEVLDNRGYDVIILMSTANISSMTARNTIFLEPSRILPPLVSSIVEDHQVGVIVPVEEMLPVQAQKWQILQKSPVFSLGNPIHDSEQKIIDAGKELLAKGADVIMLDCLGFHQRHRDLLQKQLDVPVLLSNVLIARLAAELLV